MNTIVDPETECLKLKKPINDNHRLAQTAAAEAVERGVLTGELLGKWKELLPHGRFEKFTETHFDGSLRTARVYMQAAKQLNALPKRQRSAVLNQERSIAGLIESTQPKPPKSSPTLPKAAPPPDEDDEEDSDEPVSQVTGPTGPKRNGAKPASGDYGKCPSCAGTKWDQDEAGVFCVKCHQPHGEPAGDVDDEHVATVRRKTIKTIEALERCFDDLDTMLSNPEHAKALTMCRELRVIAREWK